jgi:hypothetical protein
VEQAEMVKMLRDAGYDEQADAVASVTQADEAALDEWLSDPVNKQRWEQALADAQR